MLLNEFIEKVIIHEADKSTGKRTQKVDIYLNFIGKFDLPEWEEENLPFQEESSKRNRKPRTEKDREYDRRRYAKKKAARLAKEEAERAKVLSGTSFESLVNAPSQKGNEKIAV